MPELPEVETVRRGLEPILKGAEIRHVRLRRADLRTPFPAGFATRLEGARVMSLRRRAKYILADLDTGDVWLTHLGMSGSFRSLPKGAAFTPGAHDHVILTLKNGTRLAFNDPRRFGQMDVFHRPEEGRHPALKNLGPEPLERGFTGAVLARRLKGKKVPIKVALLDQRLVAGVGNIYASEALFKAGIDPRLPAGTVSREEAGALAQAVKKVLKDAIKSGGSTLRDYRRIDGSTGFFQHKFAVYDHAGEQCPGCVCGGKKRIGTLIQAGRTTFFCPVKQGQTSQENYPHSFA